MDRLIKEFLNLDQSSDIPKIYKIKEKIILEAYSLHKEGNLIDAAELYQFIIDNPPIVLDLDSGQFSLLGCTTLAHCGRVAVMMVSRLVRFLRV